MDGKPGEISKVSASRWCCACATWMVKPGGISKVSASRWCCACATWMLALSAYWTTLTPAHLELINTYMDCHTMRLLSLLYV
ncbi:unnamed protein product, partial [Staurois parvus]